MTRLEELRRRFASTWEDRLACHEHYRRRQERTRSMARGPFGPPGREGRWVVYGIGAEFRRVARELNVSPAGDLGSMMGGLRRFIGQIEGDQPASAARPVPAGDIGGLVPAQSHGEPKFIGQPRKP